MDFWTAAARSFGIDRMNAMLRDVMKATENAPEPTNATEALRAANLHKLRRGLEAQIALAEPVERAEKETLARAAAALDDPYAAGGELVRQAAIARHVSPRRSVNCDDAPVTVLWEE